MLNARWRTRLRRIRTCSNGYDARKRRPSSAEVCYHTRTPEALHTLVGLSQRQRGAAMQVEKIGRNDPCFCGSGKKYKFCCLGKPEALPHSSELPFATVAEAFALRGLLAQSRPFRA